MNKTLIIAEAGVNHNGSLKNCIKLVNLAKKIGADIIKFQTFKAENLSTRNSPKAAYQKKYKKNETQFEMLKKLELSRENHFKIKSHCKKKNIEFLSSGFDVEDLKFLNNLNLKKFKIPSGEITNYIYLKKIASFKKEVILSTGMSTMKEIQNAIRILINNGLKKNKIKLLHCSTDYPAKISSINLKAINSLKKKFKIDVGYSDHTTSAVVPALAVALGATIIEKHLTLSNNLAGPDHKSSLNPQNFEIMVKNIRDAEKSLGDGRKIPTNDEKKNIKIVRKSIVAKKYIEKGQKFTLDNITFKRPGFGISPMNINKVLGKKAKKNYKIDTFIKI